MPRSKRSASILPLSKICVQYASQPAFISRDQRYTYAEFNTLILKISAGLRRKCDIRKGDRVALLSGNSIYLPPLIFALFNIGAVAVPINFRIPAGQIKEMLKSIHCRKILIAKKYMDKQISASFSVVQIEKFFTGLEEIKYEENPVNFSSQQTATIIFTSGSTGRPKAVVHTIGNHYYNARGSNLKIYLHAGDRWLLSLPLFHVGGLAILFRTLLCGAACVMADEKKKIGMVIREQKITHLSLVGTQLYRLLAEPKAPSVSGQLKAILMGGGPVADNLIARAVKAHLPIYLSYGLTEMASQVATTMQIRAVARPDFHYAGEILKYRKLKIDKQQEILVKGLTLFRGYWKKQRIYRAVDRNGWFHTGDLGRLNSNGNLLVYGRRDSMFISGGENIYPEEIERHLHNLKEIQDVLVVPLADKEYGHRPAAFIKLNKGQKINPKYLRACLQKKIASYKIPQFFFPWPENQAGLKPDRSKLKLLAEDLILNT